MASLNSVQIIGHLGRDPELKYTQSGNGICNLSVATDESWTDRDGNRQERTEWHRVVAYGKTAELCSNYLHKGSTVYVDGSLQTRKRFAQSAAQSSHADTMNLAVSAGTGRKQNLPCKNDKCHRNIFDDDTLLRLTIEQLRTTQTPLSITSQLGAASSCATCANLKMAVWLDELLYLRKMRKQA